MSLERERERDRERERERERDYLSNEELMACWWVFKGSL